VARCAWCNKEIADDCEVFGIGARLREGVHLEGVEGEVIEVFSVAMNRNIPVAVVSGDSQAKRDGLDLMFMACTRSCATALKAALEGEKEEFDNITYLH